MTLSINLPRKLEDRLRRQAAKSGVDAADYVIQTLESDLLRAQDDAPTHLSPDKTRLLRDINSGLSPEIWGRYHKLTRKRRAETLTSKEHRELIKLSDLVEEANARRLELAVDYAQSKGKRLVDVMTELGIGRLANV